MQRALQWMPPPANRLENGVRIAEQSIMAALRRRLTVPPLLNLVCVLLVIAALDLAREICIPVALAILLTFVLAPVATVLQRAHVPRVLAAVSVVLLVLAALFVGGWLVAGQLMQLADKLPQYQQSVHEKLQSLHFKPGGTLDRLDTTLQGYASEVESIEPATATGETPAAASAPAPIEVKLAKTPISGLDVARNAAVQGSRPVVTLGMILILSLFMLVQREDLRDRAIRLLGRGNLHTTTQTIDDAVDRVSRYLLYQLVVNCVYGGCVWAGLSLIGVPYAGLFGLMAGALRFLPYFGILAAGVLPAAMAFFTAPGFAEILEVLALFAVLETVTAWFVEPWLYGSKTGISPLAILAGALFWAWIWGPAGLLLSTPLTVCLAVLGRHVAGLRFLLIIFGDEPVLSPAARFYQRLLTGDAQDASRIAGRALEEKPLARVFDELFIPALIAARRHRSRGDLDDRHQNTFRTGICDLVDQMLKQDAAANSGGPVEGAEPASPRVLCMAAHDFADEVAAKVLAALLTHRHIAAVPVPLRTPPRHRAELVEKEHPEVVCVSAVQPQLPLHVRLLCRRLRATRHRVYLVAGLWRPDDGRERDEQGMPATADEVEIHVSAALERIAARLLIPKLAAPAAAAT